MAESFRCVDANPTRELFHGDVYYADVPGSEGHYGVLSGHESLVALNKGGGQLVLWMDPDGNEKRTFLIHEGCAQVLHNHLSVLGRFGCDVDDIDRESLQEKADQLRLEIDALRSQEQTDARDVEIANEELYLSWYKAQLDYVSGNAS